MMTIADAHSAMFLHLPEPFDVQTACKDNRVDIQSRFVRSVSARFSPTPEAVASELGEDEP